MVYILLLILLLTEFAVVCIMAPEAFPFIYDAIQQLVTQFLVDGDAASHGA